MKSLVAFLLLLSTSLALAVPAPPEDVVFKPTFLTGFTSLTAGTGFVAHFKEGFVFVTAHHLFGPAGGLEHDLSPTEAKQFVAALAATSMLHSSLVLTSSEMLLIPSAKAFDNHDATHDIAAFLLGNYHGASLPISDTPAKKGDIVFLLARPRGEEKLRLIRAEVSRVGVDALEYVYGEAGVNFAGTSGAPILNRSGEVLGINLGGSEFKGKAFGFANPATAFEPTVETAIKASQPQGAPLAPSKSGGG